MSNEENRLKTEKLFLSQKDMLQMFPIGKTTLQKLLNARVLPVVKIGRKYITTQKELEAWFAKYKGKEIKY